MKNVIVLGGGTSGLISALMFKGQYPHFNVKVIASKNIGIIGVGEGATEHWEHFCARISVSLAETLVECGATLKTAIKFKNWGYPDYLHNTVSALNRVGGEHYSIYAKIIADGGTNASIILPENDLALTSPDWVEGKEQIPCAQFHFNTFKTNEYLLKKCAERNIEVIDDIITDISVDQEGNISSLISDNNTYAGDLFIDCSGFAKVLMSKLGAKWISYRDNLWLNSAIAFPTEDTDEYPLYTSATAMDAGWMWNTPVLGRWGNGYVFCDKYINAEQAQAEVEKFLGKKVNIFKTIKFDAGRIDKFWIKNCIAVGLSGSFVEPLESTAISQTIVQTFLCMNLLPSWINDKESITEIYNTQMDKMCENILDFIALHYVSPREDTPFWKDLKEGRDDWMTSTLKDKLNKWTKRLPSNVEFTKYDLFTGDNWIVTMHGMGLITSDIAKREYDLLDITTKAEVDSIAPSQLNWFEENKHRLISHKKALEQFIKNYNTYGEIPWLWPR